MRGKNAYLEMRHTECLADCRQGRNDKDHLEITGVVKMRTCGECLNGSNRGTGRDRTEEHEKDKARVSGVEWGWSRKGGESTAGHGQHYQSRL